MAISRAQLRTLILLRQKAARRVYSSSRADDYKWVHEHAEGPLTQTLHRLFVSGHAELLQDDRDIAVITPKGRALLRERGIPRN